MELFKNIGKAISGAMDYVNDKNRRAAYVNRIRMVIQCEEKAAEKEYLALGRYFYNNLRDANNPVSEAHCAELDIIEARLEKALSQLEDFYAQEAAEAEENSEEIDFEGVESFDHDPMEEPVEEPAPVEAPVEEPVAESAPMEAPVEEPVAEPESVESAGAAEPDENDGLPFEG